MVTLEIKPRAAKQVRAGQNGQKRQGWHLRVLMFIVFLFLTVGVILVLKNLGF